MYAEADDKYSRANRERNEYRDKYENASSTTSSLRSEISSLRQERDNAKSELSNLKSKVSNTYPLIITDIEIANVTYDGDIHTNYGNSLYGSSTMYLQPRIKYTGLSSGNKTIKVNGTILMGLFGEEHLLLPAFHNLNLCMCTQVIITLIHFQVGVIQAKVIGEVVLIELRYGMKILA